MPTNRLKTTRAATEKKAAKKAPKKTIKKATKKATRKRKVAKRRAAGKRAPSKGAKSRATRKSILSRALVTPAKVKAMAGPPARTRVPDLSNTTVDQAFAILRAAQLTMEIFIKACNQTRSSRRSPSDNRPVRKQCTAPNATVDIGSIVGVVVD
jgi:hypothetical protein